MVRQAQKRSRIWNHDSYMMRNLQLSINQPCECRQSCVRMASLFWNQEIIPARQQSPFTANHIPCRSIQVWPGRLDIVLVKHEIPSSSKIAYCTHIPLRTSKPSQKSTAEVAGNPSTLPSSRPLLLHKLNNKQNSNVILPQIIQTRISTIHHSINNQSYTKQLHQNLHKYQNQYGCSQSLHVSLSSSACRNPPVLTCFSSRMLQEYHHQNQ